MMLVFGLNYNAKKRNLSKQYNCYILHPNITINIEKEEKVSFTLHDYNRL